MRRISRRARESYDNRRARAIREMCRRSGSESQISLQLTGWPGGSHFSDKNKDVGKVEHPGVLKSRSSRQPTLATETKTSRRWGTRCGCYLLPSAAEER